MHIADPGVLTDDEYVTAFTVLKYIRDTEMVGNIDKVVKNLLS